MCDCANMTKDNAVANNHHDSTRNDDNFETKRNPDGTIKLQNPNLVSLDVDHLYHIGFDTSQHLPELFGDVKFVCMGGTKHRMLDFARYLSSKRGQGEVQLKNLTKSSHRYAMYKIGPVLSVSHGIGIPSMTILLQEVIKLLHYAKAKDPVFIRIGTSGGLELPPGSVVVSEFGLNGLMEKSYDLVELGRVRKLPAIFDRGLAQELISMRRDSDGFQTFLGGTFAADDFYRGQARLDGPFCQHTAADKMAFLGRLRGLGVRNIEMEATAFAALTSEAGVRAADVCVTLIDRLQGDQLVTSKETMAEWQQRPMVIVERYIAHCLKHN